MTKRNWPSSPPVSGVRKLTLIEIPLPEYTKEAREKNVWGTVVVGVVCDSSGVVSSVKIIVGLPGGLTEKAVEAAKGIVFDPAVEDGQPVPKYIEIGYDFKPWDERATFVAL
jgi:TonB family protein